MREKNIQNVFMVTLALACFAFATNVTAEEIPVDFLINGVQQAGSLIRNGKMQVLITETKHPASDSTDQELDNYINRLKEILKKQGFSESQIEAKMENMLFSTKIDRQGWSRNKNLRYTFENPGKFCREVTTTLLTSPKGMHQIVSFDGTKTMTVDVANKYATIKPEPPSIFYTHPLEFGRLLEGVINKSAVNLLGKEGESNSKTYILEATLPMDMDPFESYRLLGVKRIKFWVDCSKGFIIPKAEYYNSEDLLLKEIHASDFQMVNEGIWFPTHGIITRYACKEYPLTTEEWVFKKVKFNVDVSEEAFQPPIPRGTHVMDHHFSPPFAYTAP